MFLLSSLFLLILPIPTTTRSAFLSSKELGMQVREMMMNELNLYDKKGTAFRQAVRTDKISETIMTSTPEGLCQLNNNSKIYDCFIYAVPPGMSTISAKFTMRRTRRRRSATLTATLYEIWQGGSRGVLGRGGIDGGELDIPNIRLEVLRNAAHWFNKESSTSTTVDRWVKVEVLANGHPAQYFDYFDGAPELDFVYYDGPKASECDPSVECCLVEHYVNFTEIGWDKFIQYPAGFYANYCMGPSNMRCPHENPEVEYLLSTARAQSELPLKPFACAPRSFAPLRILYTVGPNHSMSLVLPDMIALSCSCMA